MKAAEALALANEIGQIVSKYGTATKGNADSGNHGHAGRLGIRGGSAPADGQFNRTDVTIGRKTFAIYRNPETTITTSSDIVAHTLQRLPKREINASACERIEVYDNPEDVIARLNDLGFDNTGYAKGAYVLETRTIYTSIYDPDSEEDTNRSFLHEFGHSVAGMDEDRAEEFVKTYSGLVETYDWSADPATLGIERATKGTKEPTALDLAYEIELVLNASKAAAPMPKIAKSLAAQLRKLFKSIEKETRSKVQSTKSPEEIAPILKKILEKNRVAFVRIIQAKRKTAFYAGIKHSKRIAAKKALLSDPIVGIVKRMLEKSFIASNDTMDRIMGDVMGTLAQGFSEEKGTYDIARMLELVFENISPGRADLIARTEINSAQNQGAFEQFKEMEVEYQQWWTAEDERVRDGSKGSADHVAMHGQIVAVGDPFNNGLLYPGDTDGDIGEWINCRCTTVPYLMPWTFKAPDDMVQFYEDDIVPVESDKAAQKGNADSGNHGHAGRLGIRGGSAPSDGGSLKTPGDHTVMDKEKSQILQRLLNSRDVFDENNTIRKEIHPEFGSRNDAVLELMAKERGFGRLPTVVTDEEFDKMGVMSVYGVMYRGTGDDENHIENLKHGELEMGTGNHGNGLYFSGSYDLAREYCTTPKTMVEAILKPDAKVLTTKNLREMHRDFERSDRTDGRLATALLDDGRYATYLGYDAMYVRELDYMVVLNRGALCIPERPVPRNPKET